MRNKWSERNTEENDENGCLSLMAKRKLNDNKRLKWLSRNVCLFGRGLNMKGIIVEALFYRKAFWITGFPSPFLFGLFYWEVHHI